MVVIRIVEVTGMKTISTRPYDPSDLSIIVQLFKEAVAAINIKNYTPEQIAVWTDVNIESWKTSLEKNVTLIAEIEGIIVGFADMTHQGHLNRLYVHKDYQGRWVSLYLFREIEKAARSLKLSKIITDCSITAKIPAERMGFKVIRQQTVTKHGTSFINYHMEKQLT